MRIRLLAFASAAELIGADELDLELAANATTSDLEALLVGRHPELESLWHRLAIAVDGRLAVESQPLREGCEVALLPPVSGGLEEAPCAELTDGPIDERALARRLRHSSCGAVVLFHGNVRDHHDGRRVRALSYSAYRPMALARLQAIVRELEAGSDGLRAAIVHRLGPVPIGEASVVIGVASPHREAAYQASRTALERLKREVPIWKHEEYADGSSRWREEESLLPAAASRP